MSYRSGVASARLSLPGLGIPAIACDREAIARRRLVRLISSLTWLEL
ncbi:hypothetical protein [Leptolyngbya sp. CCY15150]|nr:hypothetical protein [Leptolyngbya sp. CCY15150]